MSELFTKAATRLPINFPINPFENSIVYYEIIMYQNEEMIEALLLKSEDTETSSFLLVGVSSNKDSLFAINKKNALKALNKILSRLTFLFEDGDNNKEISIREINEVIQSLMRIPDVSLNNNDRFVQLTDNFYGLINNVEEIKTTAKINLQISEDSYIEPDEFSFVGHVSSDDYGEIVLTDILKKNLKSFHLINEFPIFVDCGKGMQQQYVGLILFVRKENNSTVTLNFSSNVYNLKKTKMGALSAEDIDGRNVIDFMIRGNGWEVNIEDINRHNQPFLVLMPIHNIKVETESIGIGNVEFLPSNSKNNDVLKMKDKMKDKLNDYTWAKVNVDSYSFYESYLQAKKQIEEALNAVNHLVKQDTLFELYSTENTITEWNRDFFIPKPKISSHVYIRNLITNGIIISDMEQIRVPNILKLDESFNEKIERLDWYEDLIAANMDNSVSKGTKNLLNSLKWLKRSWDSTNLEDQIIFSNISIEFLLSGETAPPLLGKEIKNKIISAALKEFDLVFDGSDEEKNKLHSDINQKFSGAITNPPLFAKLNQLIKRLEIPIKNSDNDSLNLIRKKRNDLVHGRATENLDMMDIWKANTIIGMIIAYKMKSKDGN
ncbi:hypothetical protein ABER98_10885 [Domibacillus aminovorans]|uniref:hypothetical protein n=1 Tax=Domibacillus aminovorans TaxID=29332 RepID=UPI003D19110C